MPVWHEKTRSLVKAGKLALLGVIQEQHPDRCSLFAQWKQFDWPILHDPINVQGARAVPIITAIDEYGVVRLRRPRPESIEADFVNKEFPAPSDVASAPKATKPDLEVLKQTCARSDDPADAMRYADALVLWGSSWGGPSRLDTAIAAYQHVIERTPDNGDAQFRLGVCYRMRYDSPARAANDFQRAIEHWGRSLDIDPNHYIRRRRIEQYGPRLDKPYPFYDWVTQARREITARGEHPFPLVAEPGGAEIAHPGKFVASAETTREPDPKGRIRRDTGNLIHVEATVVPSPIKPGAAARIHVTFRTNADKKAHWNNESAPLTIWVNPPKGWEVDHQRLTAPQPPKAVSNEPREINFEVRAPKDMTQKETILPAYALFYACEDVDGVCHYLRRDIEIRIRVAP